MSARRWWRCSHCRSVGRWPAPRPRCTQPRSAPTAEGKGFSPPISLDSLKQRDKELEALRAEQRKTLEKEAKLKREIELLGDDRRKFNQQIIDTASRVAVVEERIAKTQERLAPLDDSEQALRDLIAAAAQRHCRGAGGLAAHRPPCACRPS